MFYTQDTHQKVKLSTSYTQYVDFLGKNKVDEMPVDNFKKFF